MTVAWNSLSEEVNHYRSRHTWASDVSLVSHCLPRAQLTKVKGCLWLCYHKRKYFQGTPTLPLDPQVPSHNILSRWAGKVFIPKQPPGAKVNNWQGGEPMLYAQGALARQAGSLTGARLGENEALSRDR